MVSESLNNIVFFTLIAPRKQKDNLLAALSGTGVLAISTMYGKGSVKASYIRDVLGLVPEENKVVITCLLPTEKSGAIFRMLDEKFNFKEPNTGIAFTVPIERLSSYRRIIAMENYKDIKALYIIVNAGFVNEVMDIARATGAEGATIINARGEGVMHKTFMGITVDSEKEIILSLVSEDTAEKIMVAIEEAAGWKSPAHSVCFTIPVDKMTGIRYVEKK